MWNLFKKNLYGILMLVGLLLVVSETLKFQYKVAQREAHKNAKIAIISKAMQVYDLNPEVVKSLGRQLDLLTHDEDSYRYRFHDK